MKEQKIALITGATGGIGLQVAKRLGNDGYKVLINGIEHDKGPEIVKQLQLDNIQSEYFGFDVTNEEEVNGNIIAIGNKYGKIDVLVNNAASKGSSLDEFFKPFEEYSLQTWRQVMAVNIDGLFLVAQAVGKQMKLQGGGSIIQTSSIYGVRAPDQRIYEGSQYNGRPINTPAVYSASKAAVIGLTSYLSTYWADSGIRVNSLTPGGISSGQNKTFDEKYSNRVPLGRMGQASELTGALIYLASDASSYVTGQNLIVDCGLSTW